MEERSTTIDDIGDISFTFSADGGEERFPKSPNHFRGVMQIKQSSSDAIFPHGPYPMGND
jgi:hypothetical protein